MEHLMANGLEQMGFANAGFPVQEKWIEQGPFRLGDGQSGLVRKTAVLIHHERIERI